MFVHSITALMIASLVSGQTPLPATPAAPPATQDSPAQSAPAAPGPVAPEPASQVAPGPVGQAAPSPAAQPIVVPVGTAIQLTLMSAVKSKSTKAGDSVRAVVAFPVTIGTQLAIPAGTFVDGSVLQVTARTGGGQQPVFRVHFTQLVFSNGYSVALNGENTQALLLPDETTAPAIKVAELVPPRLPGMHFAMGEGQTIGTLQPPAQTGPPMGLIVGLSVGGTAALILLGMLAGRHHAANTDLVLYNAGWQFQMVLDSPLTLDAAQVAAAATPRTN